MWLKQHANSLWYYAGKIKLYAGLIVNYDSVNMIMYSNYDSNIYIYNMHQGWRLLKIFPCVIDDIIEKLICDTKYLYVSMKRYDRTVIYVIDINDDLFYSHIVEPACCKCLTITILDNQLLTLLMSGGNRINRLYERELSLVFDMQTCFNANIW